jgi:hypothetical protein
LLTINGIVKFTNFVAVQQVHQAVEVAGDKKRNSRKVVRVLRSPVHLKIPRNRLKMFAKVLPIQVEVFQIPLDPHEEPAHFVVLMLVGVQNVPAVVVEEVGDSSHDSFTVGTIYQQMPMFAG